MTTNNSNNNTTPTTTPTGLSTNDNDNNSEPGGRRSSSEGIVTIATTTTIFDHGEEEEDDDGQLNIGQGSLTPGDCDSGGSGSGSSSGSLDLDGDDGDDDRGIKVGCGGQSSSSSSSTATTSGDEQTGQQQQQQQQDSTKSPSPSQRHNKAKKIIVTIATILMILGSTATFLLGSHSHFKSHEPNKCSMTWMYQRPYYVPIPLTPSSSPSPSFPHYNLYAYAEGDRALRAISSPNHRFTGIPVLFIPGNAGSHSQVRSLASVALWKQKDSETPFHFDFFSVDLNEEFSGLYGYSLRRQVEFTREAVRRIAGLYEDFHRVVLVGHSMGGVIAKGVVGGDHPGIDSNLIITLATPHSKPVVVLDPEQELFYHWIKKNWSGMLVSPSSSPAQQQSTNMTLVSIAGGDRDVQVPSKLTAWPPFTTIHTTTTGIPGVWASTDHLCIVWCKELVLTVVRALFDLVELHPRNKYYVVGDGEGVRGRVLGYHFVGDGRGGWGKSYHSQRKRRSVADVISLRGKEVELVVPEDGDGGVLRCVPGSLAKPLYLLFPVQYLARDFDEDDDDSRVIVMTTNTKNNEDWLMGCREEGGGECTEAEPLSPNHYTTTIIPHMKRRRKVAHIPIKQLSSYTHLVVKMEPHQGFKSCMMLEGYGVGERRRPLLPQEDSWGHEFVVRNKIFFNLTMNLAGGRGRSVLDYLMAWRVDAVVVSDGGDDGSSSVKCTETHHLLAQFTSASTQQFRFLKNESLIARYHDTSSLSSPAFVTLYLEPTCTYRVTVKLAPLESAGQLFRLVALWVPSFIVGVVVMGMYYQDCDGSGGCWVSFHRVLLGNVVGLGVIPGVVVAVVLGVGLPTDWPVDNPFEYSPLLPVITNMIAYSAALALSTLAWYALVTSGTVVHSLLIRLLSTRLRGWVPEWVMGRSGSGSHSSNNLASSARTIITDQITDTALEMTLTRFPLTMAVLLLCLSFATCGGLGIMAGLGFYVVKLFRMYEEALGELLKGRIQGGSSIFNSAELGRFNFHFSCFMLWGLLGGLNVPGLLHWTRMGGSSGLAGGGGSGMVEWDLSMYLCLLLLPTVAVLWQEFVPRMEPTMWNLHRHIFYGVGLATILWGTHRLYVTSFLVVFVFLSMALCQMVSIMVDGTLLSSQQQQQQQQQQQTSSGHAGEQQQQEEGQRSNSNQIVNDDD